VTHRLEKGRALIITGPRDSGKTKLAREIAAAYGNFLEISARQLESVFGLGNLFAGHDVVTLVVEGWPSISLPCLRSMITSENMRTERKGHPSAIVPTPNFIFVTGDRDVVSLSDRNDRRFTVIRTDEGATT
jgi:energy-coupling factor transporter ATP-binding protein EcfA2